MERTLLETIQALGLDVQLAIILFLFALDGLGTLGRRIVAWRAAQPLRAPRRSAAVGPSAAGDDDAWAPGDVSAMSGTAA